MKKDNLVSIIMPLYNKGKYIEDTLRSVIEQTYTEWELIVIDDASTDKGSEIVRQYSKKDSRIKYYRNQYNIGAAESRNYAIRKANGTYIAFLDADDLWKKEKLEKQIAYMKEKGIAFCYSACEIIDEHGWFKGNVRRVPAKVNYHTLLCGNPIPCLTVVLDRRQVSNLEMKQIGHEDYVLWLDILKDGTYAYGINEVLASYREDRSSLSGDKKRAAGWMWKIYRTYLQFGVVKSSYYFTNYVINALKKRI